MSIQSKVGFVFAAVHGVVTLVFLGIFVFGKQYDILFFQAFLDFPIVSLVQETSRGMVEAGLFPAISRFVMDFIAFFLIGGALYFAIGYMLGLFVLLIRRAWNNDWD